ncbi:MAG TPA: hypothetical protein VH142_27355 [Polyangiaceae bacterium]|jgi:hypothetical protein|nr:hypothetical protein [Polyangiaceae bacterium]
MASTPKKPKPSDKVAAKTAKVAPVRRRDGSGHIDPEHAKRLLALAGEHDAPEKDRSFFSKPRSGDTLAEEAGEEAVLAMTTGEDEFPEDRDATVEEESGGPFVETTGAEEYARGTDESNIRGATREPFPRTSGGDD